MHFEHLQLANSRRLKSTKVEPTVETTLLVRALNSGNSCAMLPLRKFLMKHYTVQLQSLPLCHIATTDGIGCEWEPVNENITTPKSNSLAEYWPINHSPSSSYALATGHDSLALPALINPPRNEYSSDNKLSPTQYKGKK